MAYKFVFVIVSNSQLNTTNVYYTTSNRYEIMKVLNKSYLDLYKNDIKFFYVEYKNMDEEIVEAGDFIYIKGTEEPIEPNILIKKIKAMNYIHSKYQYEYMINTNLSTFWNIPILLSLYNVIPRNNLFGGHVIFNSFITGTGIILSHDLIPLLLNINAYSFRVGEDVAISDYMKSHHIPMFNLAPSPNYKLNYQILDETVNDTSSPHHKNNILELNDNTYTNDILYFRVKTSDHQRDIDIAKTILKIIYNLH